MLLNAGREINLRARNQRRLVLTAVLGYRVQRRDNEPRAARFKVVTERYFYHLLTEDMCEIILWHWHPDARSADPHLHLGSTQLSPNAVISTHNHTPTGRIAFEQVLLELIQGYGVETLKPREEALAQINDSLQRFADWRTWSLRPPQ